LLLSSHCLTLEFHPRRSQSRSPVHLKGQQRGSNINPRKLGAQEAPPQILPAGTTIYSVAMLQRFSIRVRGTTGLLIAAVIIVVFLIALPAYRVFFLISVALGIVIAALLYLRNKYFPVGDKEVENKRPLGLD